MPQVVPFLAGFFGVTGAASAGTLAFVQGAAFAQTIVGKLLVTVAVSALSTAMQPKPKAQVASGIRTDHTMTGGTTPANFILGRYATEGQLVAPPMSHGKSGGTPNAYLTYVIELSDIPGQTLESVMIDGAPVTLGSTPHADYGLPVEGLYLNYAWVKYYDGTQTVTDPMLVAKYGSDPDRPWTTAMIGTGICYAICTFRLKRNLYSGFPRVRFVMGGIPLYDPRLDTTVGGSGAHRWDDQSTWEISENNGVQIYNIMRGITLPSGDIWGGEVEAEDLPLSNLFAAMNVADASKDLSGGGTEPTYRSSYEVFVSDEPASVIEELLKACSGQVSEVGGIWKARFGGPGLPVFFFTDDDVNITESQNFEPFPGVGGTYNGIHASYPAPDALWQSADAPPRYNATYETDDGNKRLVADLTLPAAPYPDQVQRLMRAYIEEERRMRQHTLSLAPEAIPLEPLDVASWTSSRHSYSAKEFEIASIVDPLVLSRPQVSMRERDDTDYDWNTGHELPNSFPSLVIQAPTPYELFSWVLAATTIEDASGTSRRPALLINWNSADYDDISGLVYQIRVQATGVKVAAGVVGDFSENEEIVSSGILPNTKYEVRLKPIPTSSREAIWTSWLSVTTDNLLITAADIAPDTITWSKLAQEIIDDFASISVESEVAAIIGAGNLITDPTASNHTNWSFSSGGILSTETHEESEPSSLTAIRVTMPEDGDGGCYTPELDIGSFAGRTYKVTCMARFNSGNAGDLTVQAYHREGAGVWQAGAMIDVAPALSATFAEIEAVVAQASGTGNEIRFRFFMENGSVENDWFEVTDLYGEDVTESELASSHANAAAQSEDNAYTSETSSGESEAAAATSEKLTAYAASAAANQNIARNGQFITDIIGWNSAVNASVDWVEATSTAVKETAGACSVTIDTVGSGNMYCQQEEKTHNFFPSGSKFDFAYYAEMSDASTGVVNVRAALQLTEADGSTSSVYGDWETVTEAYQQFSGSLLTAVDAVAVRVRMQIEDDAGAVVGDTARFSDVTMRDVTSRDAAADSAATAVSNSGSAVEAKDDAEEASALALAYRKLSAYAQQAATNGNLIQNGQCILDILGWTNTSNGTATWAADTSTSKPTEGRLNLEIGTLGSGSISTELPWVDANHLDDAPLDI